MAVNRYDATRSWYAISTYSGYEDKVADSINQRTNTVEMADKIFEACKFFCSFGNNSDFFVYVSKVC